jgi:hypothetical protein
MTNLQFYLSTLLNNVIKAVSSKTKSTLVSFTFLLAMSLKRLASAWRSARLPWRKEILVGVDRNGNEYYESFEKRESKHNQQVVGNCQVFTTYV